MKYYPDIEIKKFQYMLVSMNLKEIMLIEISQKERTNLYDLFIRNA